MKYSQKHHILEPPTNIWSILRQEYNHSLLKFQFHFTFVCLDSVFVEPKMGNPLPIDIPPLACPLMFGCTANDPSIQNFQYAASVGTQDKW